MPELRLGHEPNERSTSPPSPTAVMSRDTVHRCLGTSLTVGLWLVVAGGIELELAWEDPVGRVVIRTWRSLTRMSTRVPAWRRPMPMWPRCGCAAARSRAGRPSRPVGACRR